MSPVAHGTTAQDDLVLAIDMVADEGCDPDLELERCQEDWLISEVPHPEQIVWEALLIDGDDVRLQDAAASFAERLARVEEGDRDPLPF